MFLLNSQEMKPATRLQTSASGRMNGVPRKSLGSASKSVETGTSDALMDAVNSELFSMEIKTCVITGKGKDIHIIKLSNVLSFTCICLKCGRGFLTKSALKTHTKIHVQSDDSNATATVTVDREPTKKSLSSWKRTAKSSKAVIGSVNVEPTCKNDIEADSTVRLTVNRENRNAAKKSRLTRECPGNANNAVLEAVDVLRTGQNYSPVNNDTEADNCSVLGNKCNGIVNVDHADHKAKTANHSDVDVVNKTGNVSSEMKAEADISDGKSVIPDADDGIPDTEDGIPDAENDTFNTEADILDADADDILEAETDIPGADDDILEYEANISDAEADIDGKFDNAYIMDHGYCKRVVHDNPRKAIVECVTETDTHRVNEKHLVEKRKSNPQLVQSKVISGSAIKHRGREHRPNELSPKTKEIKTQHRRKKRKEPQIQKCNYCGKTVQGNQAFMEHVNMHTGEKPYVCNVCGHRYSRKLYLNEHFRLHTGEDIHTCQDCGKKFTKSSALQKHKMCHTGEKPYPCTICGRKFRLKIRVSRHMIVHTGEKPHLCTVCGKGFTTLFSLKDHARNHEGDTSRPYLCSLCGKTFRHSSSLTKHRRVDHVGQSQSCEICGKLFKSPSYFKIHLMSHGPERTYPCSKCNQTFSTLSAFKTHIPCYRSEIPYPCTQCGKSFRFKHSLKKHVRIIHEGLSQSCDICGKVFKGADYLKTHSLIHTGERPYRCSVCGQKFSSRVVFEDHMRKHTGEKPFECSHCGQVFRMRISLMGHIKHQHKHVVQHTDREAASTTRNGDPKDPYPDSNKVLLVFSDDWVE